MNSVGAADPLSIPLRRVGRERSARDRPGLSLPAQLKAASLSPRASELDGISATKHPSTTVAGLSPRYIGYFVRPHSPAGRWRSTSPTSTAGQINDAVVLNYPSN